MWWVAALRPVSITKKNTSCGLAINIADLFRLAGGSVGWTALACPVCCRRSRGWSPGGVRLELGGRDIGDWLWRSVLL